MNLTPDQERAIATFGKHLCVDAGAGSGKTGVLVGRIVRILEERRADLSEIVAITFTRKAAAEMKERLRKAFHDRAPVDNPAEMTYWRGLEHGVDTARISTIDSFCASLLREHALHLGLDPDFAMLADAESELFRSEVVKRSLSELLDEKSDTALRVATEHGIGETQQTIERMLRQSDVMTRLGRTLPLDDPAALHAHWEQLLAEGFMAFRDELATFDGRCTKPEDGREQARSEMMRALGAFAADGDPKHLRSIVGGTANKGTTRKKNFDSDETFEALKKTQDQLAEFVEGYLDTEAMETAAALSCDLFQVYVVIAERYAEAKRDRAAMDFGDLMQTTLQMLNSRADLRNRAAASIKHLLIDEFQDTNAGQLELVSMLMRLADRPGPDLFVVGDAKQSIYRFRGAEVEVFHEARTLTDETIPLAMNFRTLPEVMAFVNDTFRRSGTLDAIESAYAGMQTEREAAVEARVEFLIPERDAEADAGTNRRAEAELIAARLAEMCGPDGVFVYDKERECERPAEYGDVALLFRRSSEITTYAEALRRAEISFDIVEGSGFYKKQEISDIRNLLQFLLDPWDEMALVGLLRSPIVALKDESLLALTWEKGLADAFHSDAALTEDEQNRRLQDARALVNDLRAHLEMPLRSFLRYALDTTRIEAILLSGPHGVQKAGNVRKLLDIAGDFAHTGPSRLRAFARYLNDLATQEVREGEAELFAGSRGAVRLMTVHKAKGLEFPITVLAESSHSPGGGRTSSVMALHRQMGLVSKFTGIDGELVTPPVARLIARTNTIEEAQEEARILYVAMTRARDWLLIGGVLKAGKNSWLAQLDELYALSARQHDEEVAGDGWTAIVRRMPGDARQTQRTKYTRPSESIEILMDRAASLPGAHHATAPIAVSAILDFTDEPRDQPPPHAKPPHEGALDPQLRGTLAHRLLELWGFSKTPAPIDRVLALGGTSIEAWPDYEDYLRQTASRVEESELFSRLQTDSRLRREVPFLFQLEGRWLSGTVDAVLEDGTLIDYKTGAYHAESFERYARQIRLYAAAMRATSTTAPKEGILFYVDSGETHLVSIDDDAMDAALAEARTALNAMRDTVA